MYRPLVTAVEVGRLVGCAAAIEAERFLAEKGFELEAVAPAPLEADGRHEPEVAATPE
jgi:hypothetical protein